MSGEIIHWLKRLKEAISQLQIVVYAHGERHESGGGDQLSLSASQVTSGIFNIDRIPVNEIIQIGLKTNLPAAGVPGRLYYATDTYELLRDNGTSWDEITPHAAPG